MPRTSNEIRHAMLVDRDDPFLAARMAAQPDMYNFRRTRRTPAPLADRFRLINKQESNI